MISGHGAPAPPTSEIDVFTVASGIGGSDRRTGLGPPALRERGLEACLQGRGVAVRSVDIAPAMMTGTGDAARLRSVANLGSRIANRVRTSVSSHRRFIVLGGDHSCAVGTWSGAANALAGPLGLVWLDAHMDCHVPETSPSGNPHGMPLAHLLGFGAPALTRLADPGPALNPANLCLVGVRCFEPEELSLVERLGIRVFSADHVRRRGLKQAIRDAVTIASTNTAGFGLSIDLDAIDPSEAPGVDIQVPGGLAAQDLLDGLPNVIDQPGYLGLEICEFNPARDKRNATARLARDLIVNATTIGDRS